MAKKKKKSAAKKKAAPKRKAAPKKKAAAKKPAPKKAAPKKKAAAKKKTRAQKPAVLPWRAPLPGESKIGIVDDFFAHIGVIAFTLEAPLAMGEKLHVRGHTTDLTQAVESMQIGHQAVTTADIGAAVGIKVGERCRKGDYVYKVG